MLYEPLDVSIVILTMEAGPTRLVHLAPEGEAGRSEASLNLGMAGWVEEPWSGSGRPPYRTNPTFEFFFQSFAQHIAVHMPVFKQAVEAAPDGRFPLVDRRAGAPAGPPAPRDVIGTVEVSGGQQVPGEYRANDDYLPLTDDGPPTLEVATVRCWKAIHAALPVSMPDLTAWTSEERRAAMAARCISEPNHPYFEHLEVAFAIVERAREADAVSDKWNRGELVEARRRLDLALEMAPRDAACLYGIGSICQLEHRYLDAARFLAQSLDENPLYTDTATWLGHCALMLDMPWIVQKYLDAAVCYHPGMCANWDYLGCARMLVGNPEGARTSLEVARLLAPDHGLICAHLALADQVLAGDVPCPRTIKEIMEATL